MKRRLPSSALALAVLLASCSSGSRLSNQVIVHLDGDPSDVAGAQRVADAECRRRGGQARFLAIMSNSSGFEDENFRSPDAAFACDPLR